MDAAGSRTLDVSSANHLRGRQWRRLELAILGCLLAGEVGKQAAIFAAGPSPLVWDAGQYWRLGGQVAGGDVLLLGSPIAFRTPGYPAFVGACRALAGSHALAAAVVLQHVLVIGVSLATWRLCRRLSGRWTVGLAGYLLSVCCLARSWHANTLLTDTLFTFLLMLHVGAAMTCLRRLTVAAAMATGLTLALCVLVRPVAQLLWIPMFGLALWPHGGDAPRRGPLRAVGSVAAGMAILAIALTPWLARNWVMFGHPFLIQLTGRGLWIVSFQGGAGAGLPLPREGPATERLAERMRVADASPDLRDAWQVSDALRKAGLSDAEADKLMRSVCLQAIRAAPARFAFACVKRLADYWRCVVNRYPFFGPADWSAGDFDGQRRWRMEGLAGPCEAILSHAPARSLWANSLVALAAWIGVAGLLAQPATRRFGLALGLTLAYFALITAVFEIPNYRYRMVVEPLIIVAACCGIPHALTLTIGRLSLKFCDSSL